MSGTEHIDMAARAWFVRLNDAEAGESDWLEFIAWSEADEAHRLAYDRVEQLWVSLDDAAAPEPANDERPSSKGRRFAWTYPAAGIAAAVAIAVGVGLPFISGGGQVYRTDDQSRIVALEDGSQILLNRHSEIRVRLEKGRRDVVLKDGEAAFDVAHDAGRPFTVSAGGHEVRVLGTAFNVLSHDDRFSVGVARGVVSVTPDGQQAVRLTAGQKVDQTRGGRLALSAIDPMQTSSWRDGVLVYRNADLSEIGADLSRYLDKPVTVSPSARALRYTGVLKLGDETTMLQQLEDLMPVQASGSQSEVVLNPRAAD